MPAVGIGVDGHDLAGLELIRHVRARCGDYGADFVAGNHFRLRHGVAPAPGVEVAAAEAYVAQLQQDFAGTGGRDGQLREADLAGLGNLNRFHSDMFLI